jgi:hypothetical protein
LHYREPDRDCTIANLTARPDDRCWISGGDSGFTMTAAPPRFFF